jgi:hypothetical protein
LEGEDTRHTSVVLRKRRDGDAAPIGAGPALAESLVRQMATEAQPLAYFVSGRPFTRRWARLRRNIGEWVTCRHHASVRDMADTLLQTFPVQSLRAIHHERSTAVASLTG